MYNSRYLFFFLPVLALVYWCRRGECRRLRQVKTQNGTLVLSTSNEEVEFQYYDTPKKTYKSMKKSYVSGMVQVGMRGWCVMVLLLYHLGKIPRYICAVQIICR